MHSSCAIKTRKMWLLHYTWKPLAWQKFALWCCSIAIEISKTSFYFILNIFRLQLSKSPFLHLLLWQGINHWYLKGKNCAVHVLSRPGKCGCFIRHGSLWHDEILSFDVDQLQSKYQKPHFTLFSTFSGFSSQSPHSHICY